VAQGVGPKFKLQYCKNKKIKKIANRKRINRVAQVVECLPNKSKALSLTPHYCQKRSKKPTKAPKSSHRT
jgi:hypothetical protein